MISVYIRKITHYLELKIKMGAFPINWTIFVFLN